MLKSAYTKTRASQHVPRNTADSSVRAEVTRGPGATKAQGLVVSGLQNTLRCIQALFSKSVKEQKIGKQQFSRKCWSETKEKNRLNSLPSFQVALVKSLNSLEPLVKLFLIY